MRNYLPYLVCLIGLLSPACSSSGSNPDGSSSASSGDPPDAGEMPDAGNMPDAQPDDAGNPAKDPIHVVLIGSSTAEGKNLDVEMYGGRVGGLDDRYSNRYERYLDDLYPGSTVLNLAKAGASTYEVLPTGSATPIPMGLTGPDPTRNVTFALSKNPHAIIINFPANRTPSVAQYVANHREVVDASTAAGVPIWVALPNPANDAVDIAEQSALKDALLAEFGTKTLDFYNARLGPNGTALLNTRLTDAAQHPNAEGHRLLFEVIVAADIPKAIGP